MVIDNNDIDMVCIGVLNGVSGSDTRVDGDNERYFLGMKYIDMFFTETVSLTAQRQADERTDPPSFKKTVHYHT